MVSSHSLELIDTKEFNKILKKFAKRGGEADVVHRQVTRAIILWAEGIDPQLPLTHHGENRLPHAVKYDLKGHHRLVVYEHAGKRIPLMVGSHDDVDQWLTNNKGRDFAVDSKTNRVTHVPTSTDPEVKPVKLLKYDLERSGIDYVDAEGRFLDFHALRHTFISRLAKSGVNPSMAKTLARHSTITLTLDHYTHVLDSDVRAALGTLPSIGSTNGKADQEKNPAA